jgi:hypothetical protein
LFSVEGGEDAVKEDEGDDANLSVVAVVAMVVVGDAVAVLVVGDSIVLVEVLRQVVMVSTIVAVESLPLPPAPGVEGVDTNDGDNKVEYDVVVTAAG